PALSVNSDRRGYQGIVGGSSPAHLANQLSPGPPHPPAPTFASSSTFTIASPTPLAEAGFWPVTRRPATATIAWNFGAFRMIAPCSASLLSSRKGTTLARPTASSSSFVNAETSFPATRYEPSESRTSTRAEGPWQTAATTPPAS